MASYATPPQLIVLDLDHTVDPTHGKPELSVYNGYYGGCNPLCAPFNHN